MVNQQLFFKGAIGYALKNVLTIIFNCKSLRQKEIIENFCVCVTKPKKRREKKFQRRWKKGVKAAAEAATSSVCVWEKRKLLLFKGRFSKEKFPFFSKNKKKNCGEKEIIFYFDLSSSFLFSSLRKKKVFKKERKIWVLKNEEQEEEQKMWKWKSSSFIFHLSHSWSLLCIHIRCKRASHLPAIRFLYLAYYSRLLSLFLSTLHSIRICLSLIHHYLRKKYQIKWNTAHISIITKSV